MSGRRKPSRRPSAGKYRKTMEKPRPLSDVGGGQGGFMTPSGNAGSFWG